ncbi:hypothetical protein TNCV_3124231 [Trichonephila clavipes]|nr:hypothetical protein TNCV_3124231 [Trichonephila clavipes]
MRCFVFSTCPSRLIVIRLTSQTFGPSYFLLFPQSTRLRNPLAKLRHAKNLKYYEEPRTPPPTMEPNKGRQPAGHLTCVRHGTYLRGGTGYSSTGSGCDPPLPSTNPKATVSE